MCLGFTRLSDFSSLGKSISLWDAFVINAAGTKKKEYPMMRKIALDSWSCALNNFPSHSEFYITVHGIE